MINTSDFFMLQCSHRTMNGSVWEEITIVQEDCQAVDFSTASFKNCTFNGVDFSDCLFDYATFDGCRFVECLFDATSFVAIAAEGINFRNCGIAQADFEDAQMNESFFTGCYGGANFTQANLEKSLFSLCDLDGSVMTSADLEYAEFEQCSFAGVVVNYQTRVQGAEWLYCEIADTALKSAYDFLPQQLVDCYICPYTNVSRAPVAVGRSRSRGSISIFRGVDKSAHLICSDIELFRSV